MSTEETALLAAIAASPDEDAPRLVYADFLNGKGDPRGEFITLQCRLSAARDDDARRKLRIAENKLLAAHEDTWTAAFFAVAKSTPHRRVKVLFHRGFLEEATLPIEALDDLEPLFEVAPLLRRLRFDSPFFTGQTQTPPTLAGRLSSPKLRGLRSLDLRIPAGGDAAAVELAQCKHLTGLRSLHLEATAWPLADSPMPIFSGPPETHLFTATGARALASAPHLTGVRRLELAGNALAGPGVKALLDGAWRLESLDVSGNKLDDLALAALSTSPALAKLEHLAIGGGSFSEAALRSFAKSKNLASLTSLDLRHSMLGPRGLRAFLEALALPKLTALSLEATGLGDEGVVALAKSPAVRQLSSLELGDNKVTQTGVFALADSPNLTGLTRLLLNDAWLKKKAVVEYLGASTNLAACRIYVKGTLLARSASKKADTKAKPAKKASTAKTKR